MSVYYALRMGRARVMLLHDTTLSTCSEISTHVLGTSFEFGTHSAATSTYRLNICVIKISLIRVLLIIPLEQNFYLKYLAADVEKNSPQ
jgi:hypothetical protein